MFNNLICNDILIVFPILLYFIYAINNKALEKPENNIFFEFTLFSSIYLLLTMGMINDLMLILFNLILALSYHKKRDICSIFISLFNIFIYYKYIGNYIILITILYIIYYIFYILSKKQIVTSKFLNNLIIITNNILFFILCYKKYLISDLIIVILVFTLSNFLLIKLFDKIIEVSILYKSIEQLTNDKQIADSLFKITHEIKNPLAVCKGYLDMYDVNNINHSKNYIPIVKEEIERTLILLNDFLSISRVNINLDIMDINMLLNQVFNNYKKIFKENNIKTSIDIIDDEIYIEGDYNRLFQVFVNIIKNSIEAIDNDGCLSIKMIQDNNFIDIIFEDNGAGIQEEDLEKIKIPFYTTKIKGTGLGVPLSIDIIKKHHGDIKYYSEYGNGTKVVVSLPIYKEAY